MRTHLFLTFTIFACGGDNTKVPDALNPLKDGPQVVDAPPLIDAPADTVVDIGSGGANALFWDASTSTLYLTDNTADSLDTIAGGTAAPTSFATLPASVGGISLGGIVKQSDGSFLVADFGFGSAGTLFAVPAAGGSGSALTGLDATRRRIALAQDGATLYTSYFAKSGSAFAGGVSTVVITGGSAVETEIAGATTTAGLQKVVGLAVGTDAVFVSDQTVGMIFKIDTANANAISPFATVPTADLLTALPDGSILTGGGPTISRIDSTGTVSTLTLPGVPAFSDVRGTAYDPAGHRLFIIDHSSTVGTNDSLHIVPFTP